MGLPEVHHRHRLRAEGYRDDEVQRMLRRGALTPVRRGAYVVGPLPPEAAERHHLEVRAALARMSPDAVVSHVSAAVLHGLPVWAIRIDRVHATRTRQNGAASADTCTSTAHHSRTATSRRRTGCP
jgi:predicted transcriptional regulator of viral defense system